jgi:hypothetical protein
MFCWPCITVYQYNETNVMHFSLNVLRNKGLYMFRALGARPQEALYIWHWVYCLRIMSVGSWNSQLTLYSRNIPSAVCVGPLEDEQLMLETCRGHWFSINWVKSASGWFHYTVVLIFFILIKSCVAILQLLIISIRSGLKGRPCPISWPCYPVSQHGSVWRSIIPDITTRLVP